ncbi:MAG: alkene reductase, partial [Bdellovibrionota bacterium]
GVELHGANGYLIDQFLNTASNKRADRWGTENIENRIRFAVETARRVGEAIGFDRLGIRVSPYGVFNDMQPDPDTEKVFSRLAEELGKLGLLYIHIVDHSTMGAPEVTPSVKLEIRAKFKGHTILSGGYDLDRAEHDLVEKKGELVAFGRPLISNPNFISKLRNGTPLAAADHMTFYTPGE